MKRKSVWATLLCLAVVAIMVVAATPAVAILGGQQDNGSPAKYPNVGMVQYQDPTDNNWYQFGSCILVADRQVLTAGHVAEFMLETFGSLSLTDKVRVTFDPLLPGATTTPTYYGVTTAVIHPGYFFPPDYLANAKRFFIGYGREDAAFMWLDQSVQGITPAQLVRAGGLDEVDFGQAKFTAVGYGINDFVSGNAMSWRNPNTATTWSGRNFREVSVVSQHEAFADRYLKITQAVNFGDSGGPDFDANGIVVAIHIFGSSWRAESPGYDYRLDAPAAQTFLNAWLGRPAPTL
jgi:hypothetical protein